VVLLVGLAIAYVSAALITYDFRYMLMEMGPPRVEKKMNTPGCSFFFERQPVHDCG
jgi:hypothetical protein